jgi:hypothetical protein
MAQFKVVLDEIKLSDRDTARINIAIQRAVLDELATVDQKGDQASVLLRKFGPGTNGIIAIPIELAKLDQGGLERLGELNERF